MGIHGRAGLGTGAELTMGHVGFDQAHIGFRHGHVAWGRFPPPTLSSISPDSGASGEVTAVTITGTNFRSGCTVLFGATAATGVVFVNATQITCDAPALGIDGPVDVTVTNPDNQAVTLTNGFYYKVFAWFGSAPGNWNGAYGASSSFAWHAVGVGTITLTVQSYYSSAWHTTGSYSLQSRFHGGNWQISSDGIHWANGETSIAYADLMDWTKDYQSGNGTIRCVATISTSGTTLTSATVYQNINTADYTPAGSKYWQASCDSDYPVVNSEDASPLSGIASYTGKIGNSVRTRSIITFGIGGSAASLLPVGKSLYSATLYLTAASKLDSEASDWNINWDTVTTAGNMNINDAYRYAPDVPPYTPSYPTDLGDFLAYRNRNVITGGNLTVGLAASAIQALAGNLLRMIMYVSLELYNGGSYGLDAAFGASAYKITLTWPSI